MGQKWNSPVGSSRFDQTKSLSFWDNPITMGFGMTGVMFGLLGLVRYLR